MFVRVLCLFVWNIPYCGKGITYTSQYQMYEAIVIVILQHLCFADNILITFYF